MNNWEPSSLEDRLLQEYAKTNPGTFYLEMPVRSLSKPGRARRIDALRIPGTRTRFLKSCDYSTAEVSEAAKGQRIHVIEAKHALNRGVIGQVLVARHLVEQIMEPSEIIMDVVYVESQADLEAFCEHENIGVHAYPELGAERSRAEPDDSTLSERKDERRPPDRNRRRAFLAGWTEGAEGRLYASVQKRKTHANMGNLFGWIYGDKPDEFRLATWRRYAEHGVSPTTEDEASGD